ncbi:MAG: PAS domain-containing protein [bacterium]
MIETGHGMIDLDTMLAILNAVPGDLTFVGPDDTILYFNEPRHRLFTRTKAILGTSVQSCHPAKSVPAVDKVIADLRSGVKDLVEAWVDLDGRLVNVRYLALRDERGGYLGCLEIAQDMTHVRDHCQPRPAGS